MSKTENKKSIKQKDTTLFSKVADLIEIARKTVVSTVNFTMVHAYYEIGKIIVENEQQGEHRAEYGKTLIIGLSKRLTEKFGRGFSEQNLRNMRQFFLVYSDKTSLIRQTPSGELEPVGQKDASTLQTLKGKLPVFTLSWSHYLILMRIENSEERSFYEIETLQQNWSERQLKRQYHSSLYERLALSRDKAAVMKLANEGHTVQRPEDILKNPLSLEFLGMEEKHSYSESDIENAIISKLHSFLLELGKGFLFEARQKRFSFEEKHFFVDLVFYNRLLQCYVLIDLKTEDLAHQDLGQMQMYVNYFDRYVKLNHERPTVGILLCKKKTDALVELTLPKDSNIYASEYSLYLPDKQLLQQKLNEWVLEFI